MLSLNHTLKLTLESKINLEPQKRSQRINNASSCSTISTDEGMPSASSQIRSHNLHDAKFTLKQQVTTFFSVPMQC